MLQGINGLRAKRHLLSPAGDVRTGDGVAGDCPIQDKRLIWQSKMDLASRLQDNRAKRRTRASSAPGRWKAGWLDPPVLRVRLVGQVLLPLFFLPVTTRTSRAAG
jgi:hypothetical protein